MKHLYAVITFIICSINLNSGTMYICNSGASCGCSTALTTVTATELIVGGEAAPNHAWDWTVSLENLGSHRCAAVLISAQYALTAAHCVTDITNASHLSILAGTNYYADTSAPAQRKQIIKFYVHPNYNSNTDTNDIAVLHFSSLTTSANSYVKFICLPASNVDPSPVGSNVVATGWGVTKEGGTSLSSYLQQVTVQVLSPTSTDCQQAPIYNTSLQICAGIIGGGKDTCQGDSGGPLMAFDNNLWVLAGLTSAGIGCAENGHPGIYTRVSAYIYFIEYVINFGRVPSASSSAMSNIAGNQRGFLGRPISFYIFGLLCLIHILSMMN